MGFMVDIDTGGTFTDGLFTKGAEIRRVKVDSTPHGFLAAVHGGRSCSMWIFQPYGVSG
jgi:N-methylhydantoinase A/oxoprolinase/acetone carboxylase beta subunit